MKRIILGFLLCVSFSSFAQGDFSPAILRNIEFIFDDNFIDYTRMTNYDPTVTPVDTYAVVDFQKDALNNYLNGREWSDTIYGLWNCQTQNGVNEVAVVDAMFGDTVQIDHIYRDSQNRDTLIQVFADTSGNGSLSLAQELRLFYGTNGLDSAFAGIPGQGAFGEVSYYFLRNGAGQLDSLLVAVKFMGTIFPVQTVRYYYGSNGLDSLNLFNNLNNEVEEQARATTNSMGQISAFSFYDKDMNDEWALYDTYVLSNPNFFSLPENPKAKVTVFPNPSTRFLNVETSGKGSFEVVDMSGKVLISGSLDAKDQITVEQLDAGVYMLRLKTDKGLIGEKRFVKK